MTVHFLLTAFYHDNTSRIDIKKKKKKKKGSLLLYKTNSLTNLVWYSFIFFLI